MAQEKAKAFAVADKIRFSLGYLDEAPKLLPDPYDLVFNRICWYYGFSDRSFPEVVYRMVRHGGYGYVDTTHSEFNREQLSTSSLFRTWLNDKLAIKIARLFLRNPLKRLVVDYRSPSNDRILFEKPASDL